VNDIIRNCLATVRLANPETYRNTVVFPLISRSFPACNWQTLGEGTQAGTLTITEVTQGGSVPHLKVVNQGSRPVLLIDGEELLGAKQNRVLNTSILIKENSETIVPVSCSERGRWSYSSPKFAYAGAVMAHKIRAFKSRSVARSLLTRQSFQSDQGGVWKGIDELHSSAGTSSPSSAMHHAFEAFKNDIQQCLATFKCLPDQTGVLVVVDGKVAGFDLIPHAPIYAREHEKLLKSYVMDAVICREPDQKPADTEAAKSVAEAFLKEAADAEEQQFPSVGYGRDFRYNARAASGSALLHEDTLVHAAFFAAPDAPKPRSQTSSSSTSQTAPMPDSVKPPEG